MLSTTLIPACAAAATIALTTGPGVSFTNHYLQSVGETRRVGRLWAGLAAAVGCGMVGWFGTRHDMLATAAPVLVLVGATVLLTVTDFWTHRLPDVITLALTAGAGLSCLVSALFGLLPWEAVGRAFLGALAAVITFGLIYLLPSGLGAGDVKLAFPLGLVAGSVSWTCLAHSFLYTYLLGGLVALGLLAVRRQRGTHMAFGPYMLAGTLLAWLTAPTGWLA
ncbi:prepilin peptidase [Buchananella hordeovulneris]|nr:prepilin peptidase [Buchananella hordeovulneris]